MDFLQDEDVLCDLVRSASSGDVSVESLVTEGWLTSCPWVLPTSFLIYLFEVVCYCQDNNVFLAKSFEYLQRTLQYRSSVGSPSEAPEKAFFQNSMPFSVPSLTACSPAVFNTEWTPSYQEITGVLRAYGMSVKIYKDQVGHEQYATEPSTDQESFPVRNFTLFVQLLVLGAQNRDHYYTRKDRKRLLRLACRLLIDPTLFPARPYIQQWIVCLIGCIRTGTDSKDLGKLCRIMSHHSVSGNPHHFVRLVTSFPVSADVDFLAPLRTHLAFQCWQRIIKDKQKVVIPTDSNAVLSVPPEELVRLLIKLTDQMIAIPKAQQAKWDFTDLYLQLCLVDYSFDQRQLGQRSSAQICKELQQNLLQLGLSVTDGGGILIGRTRVKEYISRLVNTLQMVEALGVSQRTASTPSNTLISQFFKRK